MGENENSSEIKIFCINGQLGWNSLSILGILIIHKEIILLSTLIGTIAIQLSVKNVPT